MESSKTIIDLCSSDEESGASIASHSDLSLLRNEPPRWNLLQALLKPRSADTDSSDCSLSDAEDDKENAPPFSMMSSTARLMLPQLDSKPSESQFTEIQILPEVDPRFMCYKSLKHPSPFFLHEDLVSITYGCTEIETIKFCQKHGLIAKSIVCENCNQVIQAPTYEKRRNCWWWLCNRKPQGKKPCKSFAFSVKKGTFFHNAHLGIYQILWVVWHFVHNMTQNNTKQYMDLGGKNNMTICDWFSFCREVCDVWMETKV